MLGYEEFKDHLLEQSKVFTPHKYQEWKPVILTEEQVNEERDYLSYTVDLPNEAAPCVCLHTAYQLYKKRENLYDAYLYAAKTLSFEKMVFDDMELLGDWNFCKTRIMLRLIDPQVSDTVPPHLICRPYLDLSVVYQIFIKLKNNQIQPVMVTERVLRKWGITEEELYEVAYINTMYKASFLYADCLDLMRCDLIQSGCDTSFINDMYAAGKMAPKSFELWDKKNVGTSAILLANPFLKEVSNILGASMYLITFPNSYKAISAADMTKEEALFCQESVADHPLHYYDLETDAVLIVKGK